MGAEPMRGVTVPPRLPFVLSLSKHVTSGGTSGTPFDGLRANGVGGSLANPNSATPSRWR